MHREFAVVNLLSVILILSRVWTVWDKRMFV